MIRIGENIMFDIDKIMDMIDEDGNFPILISAILAIIITVVTIATVPQDTWTNIGNTITDTATTIGKTISAVRFKGNY